MASKTNLEKNEKNENPGKNDEIKNVTTAQPDGTPEPVRIKVLTKIRADFGAFDAGHTYTVQKATAEKLIKSGRAEKCS